jgi:hypothetical protein
MKLRRLLAVFGLVFAPALFSQEFRGAIGGAVTDGTGHYSAPLLLPGDYDISVKLDGFTENIPQIRSEGFNIVNHAVLGPANTTAFGTNTSQGNRPRLLQIVARLVF